MELGSRVQMPAPAAKPLNPLLEFCSCVPLQSQRALELRPRSPQRLHGRAKCLHTMREGGSRQAFAEAAHAFRGCSLAAHLPGITAARAQLRQQARTPHPSRATCSYDNTRLSIRTEHLQRSRRARQLRRHLGGRGAVACKQRIRCGPLRLLLLYPALRTGVLIVKGCALRCWSCSGQQPRCGWQRVLQSRLGMPDVPHNDSDAMRAGSAMAIVLLFCRSQ